MPRGRGDLFRAERTGIAFPAERMTLVREEVTGGDGIQRPIAVRWAASLSRTSVHRTDGHNETSTCHSADGSSSVTHSVTDVELTLMSKLRYVGSEPNVISDASTTSACATTIAVPPAARAAMVV